MFGAADTWPAARPQIANWLGSHAGQVAEVLDQPLRLVGRELQERRDELIEWALSPSGLIAAITDLAGQDGHPDLAQRLAEAGVLPMFGFPTRERLLTGCRGWGPGLVAEAAQDVVGAAGELAGTDRAARLASIRAAISA